MSEQQEKWVYGVLIYTTVLLSRCFMQTFFPTLTAGLFAAILAAVIIGIYNKLTIKKLGAFILVEKPSGNRCKVSVFLWNSSVYEPINGEDYGRDGLVLITEYGTVISEIKLIPHKSSTQFSFSVDSQKPANEVNMRMGKLFSKSLAEFEFFVSNEIKEMPEETQKICYSPILLPHGVAFPKKEATADLPAEPMKTPNVFLTCYSKRIRIHTVTLYWVTHIFHWISSVVAILSAIGASVSLFFLFAYDKYYDVVTLLIALVIAMTIMAGITGNVMPPFVVRHLKSKSIIK